MSEEKGGEIDKETGLPRMTVDEREKGFGHSTIAAIVGLLFIVLIGLGSAVLIYEFGSTEVYASRIA